jgi:hypothetical protein
MSRYAANTEVSVDKSKAEIERILSRYGADEFIYGWGKSGAMIGFRMNGKFIRFTLPLPDRNDREFTHTEYRGTRRTESAAAQAWEQACRQRWRALALVIKAKLEAVESGITTFEDEFLAHIMLPDGHRVGDFMKPQVEKAYSQGLMPRSFPGLELPANAGPDADGPLIGEVVE